MRCSRVESDTSVELLGGGVSGHLRWRIVGLTVVMVGVTIGGPAASAATGGAEVTAASVAVPRPTVSVPAEQGNGIQTLLADLSQFPQYGFVQQEFFFAGTARAYNAVGPIGADGQWSVAKTATAPYKTRLIVRRPEDPAKFNGTVLVEWLNVTAGVDTSPDWNFGRTEFLREGYIWVGVSAQAVGVNALVAGDPVRYGTLTHPGDQFSYDIFSQTARALVAPKGVATLGGIRPRWLIADGESQSASRMTTYVNAFSVRDHAYDAYMIHSRSAGATAINPTGAGSVLPNPTFIRTDISTPVLVFQSETDVTRYRPARQPDSDHYRGWEVAGTAHLDAWALGPLATVLGCGFPVNEGPQHYVFRRALHDLRRWMRTPWRPPPSGPPIAFDAQGVIARDPLGNALGGIRTPQLDVPVATLSGVGNSGGLFCQLAGTTTPFSTSQLTALYGNRSEYIRRYYIALGQALGQRFLLNDDAADVLAETSEVSFP
jgi:hypothetical protein